MKNFTRLLIVSFLVSGLILSGCAEKKEKPKKAKTEEKISAAGIQYPYDDFGYRKLNEFHLRYYHVQADAIDKVLDGEMNWDEAVKDNTGLVEVWFKSDGSLLRIDRYVEKLKAICKSYLGKPADTLSYNNQTYYLQERIIQRGKQSTTYTFDYKTSIGYDNKTKQSISPDCFYEKFTSEKSMPANQSWALFWMGIGMHFVEEMDDKELERDLWEANKAALELTKMMNPPEYRKVIESWKVKKAIAGRTAVKDYGSPPSFRGIIGIKGYQFIDTELGIGLEGYLEGFPKLYSKPEIKFDTPKLMFKALIVEKSVPPGVFEGF